MDKTPFPILPATGLTDERLQAVIAEFSKISNSEFSLPLDGIECVISEDRIALRSKEMDERALVSISFLDGAANHRRLFGGGRSQQLSKALGLDQKKDLCVVDATAGLASDSFVMASLGARVIMLERNPYLSLMIGDALRIASLSDDESLREIVVRMTVQRTSSEDWLALQEDHSCEVIYLDPMFPERKKKAAVKKEMQVLQKLHNEQEKPESERLEEESKLLKIALDKARYRVVVKRPRSAPALLGSPPSYSLSGKSIRFDIYTRKKIAP